MAITWGRLGSTDVYIGIEAISTANTSNYNVTLKAYMACQYGLTLYSGGQYHIKVEIGSSSADIDGIAAYVTTSKDNGGVLIGSKSFNSISSGTYTIKATFIDTSAYGFSYSGLALKNLSVSTTLSLAALTSACSAPTSVSASGVVTPSGSFTVSWSGASGGTNNSISSYQVYWLVSSGGTAPTTSSYTGTQNVTSTSTSGSLTITLSNATRGYKIVCGVVTRGSAGSSYYSGIKTGGSVTVNVLPDTPTLKNGTTTVTGTSQTIISTSTGYSVTATAGAANAGSSPASVRYSTSASGTKSNYSSAITINPDAGKSLTYYFWTFDGLEYSSAVTITVTKNVKPNISASTFSPTSYLAQNTAANTNTYVSSVGVTATCNKSCTMTIQVLYGTTSSPSTSGYSTTKSITTTSSQTIGTYNINDLLKTVYNGVRLYFKIRISVTDGLENGNSIDSSVYSIAAKPSITIYDQFSTSNLYSGYAYDKIRLAYYKDGSMTTTSVTITVSDGTPPTYNSTPTLSVSGNTQYADVTITNPSSLKTGETLTITLTLTDGKITKTVTGTKTVFNPNFSLGSFTINPSPIEYYSTSSVTCKLLCPCTFNNDKSIAENAYKVNELTIRFTSSTTNSGGRTRTTSDCNSISAGTQTNEFIFEFKKDKFVSAGDWNKTVYNGTSTGYVHFTFKNIYGKQFTGYGSYTINYNRAPVIGNPTYQVSTNNSTWSDITSSSSLYEGQYLQAIIPITAYSNSKITVNLYQTNNSGVKQTTSFDISNGTGAQYKDITLNFGQIGEISDVSKYNSWTISASDSLGQSITSKVFTCTAVKHVAPTLPPITSTESSNYLKLASTGTPRAYAYNITYTNSGTTGSLATNYPKYYVVTSSNVRTTAISNGVTSGTTKTVSSTDDIIDTGDWGQKTVKIAVVTKVTGGIVEKIAYTNAVTLSVAQPTVAYRKNRLGVNTTSPITTTVLDVRPVAGQTIIRLGEATSGAEHFEIGIATSEMYIDIV